MSEPMVEGYAAKAAGEPLEPYCYESPPLGEHDLRVAVTHCGLCFTDVHGIDDYYGISTYPFVPGHEIVGRVTETGPAVDGLVAGDRVGIGWQGRACWECEPCLRGEEHLCTEIDEAGTWKPFGGFASSVVVDGRFAYPLPDAMPAETAAILMCAGLTVFSPLQRFGAGPGVELGVVGVGGLGHLAIEFAHAFGCRVTAISSSPDKEEAARAFGADTFVVADRDGLRSCRDRLDLLLSTIHHEGADWERLLLTLKRYGRLVLLGFGQVAFDPQELIVLQQSISGSLLGSRATMREMLAFAEAHRIAPAIELMPMAAVNRAIDHLKANRVRYRVVLVNDGAALRGGAGA